MDLELVDLVLVDLILVDLGTGGIAGELSRGWLKRRGEEGNLSTCLVSGYYMRGLNTIYYGTTDR